jgi:hypothetical protein
VSVRALSEIAFSPPSKYPKKALKSVGERPVRAVLRSLPC